MIHLPFDVYMGHCIKHLQMLKKTFLTVLFVGALFALTPVASGMGQNEGNGDNVGKEVYIGNGQYLVPENGPGNSEEVNYVQESEIAHEMNEAKKAEESRKAKQQEKAENARIYDSFGGGITIVAMCIVIGALVVLSILFYIFGSISKKFLTHKKKKKHAEKMTSPGEDDHAPASGETFAAIAAALAQHFSIDHDKEDTILTIRRMRKAYSPWNSKIYNMRDVPEVPHHSVKIGK